MTVMIRLQYPTLLLPICKLHLFCQVNRTYRKVDIYLGKHDNINKYVFISFMTHDSYQVPRRDEKMSSMIG